MNRPGFCSPALALAAYTVWLLSFPMKGPLLGELTGTPLLLTFLAVHILTLLAAGLSRPGADVGKLCDAGLGVTMAATCVFPLLPPQYAPPLLALTGASSALVMLKAGALLRWAADPCLSAASGLALGNMALLASLQLPLAPIVRAGLLAASLAALLPRMPGRAHGAAVADTTEAAAYHPFIFLYYLSSGLRYDVLQSKYAPLGLPQGTEVLFYAAAVLATCLLLRERRGLALGLGILAGLLSLAFSFGTGRTMVALNMFGMQASAGFVDIFVVWLLLRGPDPVRAFGLGIAAMCLGIACGESLSAWLGAARDQVVVAGNLALTGSMLLLSLIGGRAPGAGARTVTASRGLPDVQPASPPDDLPVQVSVPCPVAVRGSGPDAGGTPPSPAAPPTSATQGTPSEPAPGLEALPAGVRSRLSAQEANVLRLVLLGRPYRDAAAELGISESSVKTYMRRVFEKLDVAGKRAMLDEYFHKQ